eukprot:5725-Heterococcus_DN1.PRE.3
MRCALASAQVLCYLIASFNKLLRCQHAPASRMEQGSLKLATACKAITVSSSSHEHGERRELLTFQDTLM